jgi:hypothetical protein
MKLRSILHYLFDVIVAVAILLGAFYLDLVVCGINEPEKMDIISAYNIPVIGTMARNQVNNALAAIQK